MDRHKAHVCIADANPLYDKATPLVKVNEVVTRLKCGKAAKLQSITWELLNSRGEAMVYRLHAILAVLYGIPLIPHD